jgi:hypothetical protein
VIRLLLVCTIAIGLVAAEPILAQEPSTEDVVKALTPPKKLRGPPAKVRLVQLACPECPWRAIDV